MTKEIAAADPSNNGAILGDALAISASTGFVLRHAFIRVIKRGCFGSV